MSPRRPEPSDKYGGPPPEPLERLNSLTEPERMRASGLCGRCAGAGSIRTERNGHTAYIECRTCHGRGWL